MSEHPEYIRGVKDCIARLPKKLWLYTEYHAYNSDCAAALGALLPKPDHAKAAVEAWHKADSSDLILEGAQGGEVLSAFARWLEEQGVDLSRWGE